MDLWSIYTPQIANDGRLEGGAASKTNNIWPVTYEKVKTTLIPRNENAGKSLTDYNIVHSVRRLGEWNGWAINTD